MYTMSEKRRKIKKIASYQNIIVRNCPALGDDVCVSSQNHHLYFLT